MKLTPKNIVAYLFYLVAFIPPLILYKYTSELFEFNKIVVVYALTALISATWIMRMILEKRIIFVRTILDIPIVVFLLTLGISTLLSVDTTTSLYGYPSRFHGGFLSWLSYSILYWAFVSNLSKEEAKNFIYTLLASGVLVGIYGILQRYGIDDQIWEQDVKTRVFSTLGQPNWLAAWITPLILVILALILKFRKKDKRLFFFFNISFLIFTACLFYSRSRSGILSLFAAGLVFVFLIIIKSRHSKPKLIVSAKSLIAPVIAISLLGLLIGTPWSKSIFAVSQPASTKQNPQSEATSDITASEDIRKIVWKGAIDVWRDYPLFGSGTETFAYSYYQKRPVEHNYVSEWDFLYNKAHNEYLNTLATTGLAGFASYLFLTLFAFLIPAKNAFTNKSNMFINAAFAASVVSIVITNFFGFSVVPVALIFMLFPAVSVALTKENKEKSIDKPETMQVILISIVSIATVFAIYKVYGYWLSDISYARGKTFNAYGNYSEAQKALNNAVNKNPNQPFYFAELAQSSVGIALSLDDVGSQEKAREFAQIAESQALHATAMNNKNPNMYRVYAGLMTSLSSIDTSYLRNAKDAYEIGEILAPTDPKMKYRLGLTLVRLGMVDKGIAKMKEAIELKNDYVDARYALAQTYTEIDEDEKAREELVYILDNLSPDNAAVKSLLDSLDNN